MTNREEEIAAMCEIAAIESDLCVVSSIYIDLNLMMVRRETCTLIKTNCTTVTSDILLYCTKIQIFLYQQIFL